MALAVRHLELVARILDTVAELETRTAYGVVACEDAYMALSLGLTFGLTADQVARQHRELVAEQMLKGGARMDGLVAGRIVYFVFDEDAALRVMRRRTTGASIAERMRTFVTPEEGPEIAAWPAGAQAHIGSDVEAGDICPAMVVAVGATTVNLKVQLDGTDVYWAQAVEYAADKRPGTWHWMFDGQQTRYTPDRQA